MGIKNIQVLRAALNGLAWVYLLAGGVAVAYGIYGRVTVRPQYGPFSALDILIPLFWIIVVAAGFWGLRKLAGKAKDAPAA